MKVKIRYEGQPCRKCGTPVVKKEHKSNFKPKKNQPYYFLWWFRCNNCRTTYCVEEAKRFIGEEWKERLGGQGILDLYEAKKETTAVDLFMMPPSENY